MAGETVKTSDDNRSRDNVRRIILIGKTGNGKSSTGNSILGKPEFDNELSPVSVTQRCEVRTSITRKDRPKYLVCDTPGLFDNNVDVIDRALEIHSSVKTVPNPHAFLLVFSLASRMTENEQFTIDLIRIMFGEDVFKHCIVVFTRGDMTNDDGFREYLKTSPMLNTLLEKCGHRVVRIENQNLVENESTSVGVRPLLELIEQMSCNGQTFYEYSNLPRHEEVLNNHRRNYKGEGDMHSILTALNNEIGKKLPSIRDTVLRWAMYLVPSLAMWTTSDNTN